MLAKDKLLGMDKNGYNVLGITKMNPGFHKNVVCKRRKDEEKMEGKDRGTEGGEMKGRGRGKKQKGEREGSAWGPPRARTFEKA